MRILSYNIHKGFAGAFKKYTLAKIREELRKIRPDILFLQEVHGEHSGHRLRIAEWPEHSQFEYLAEDFWPHFVYGKNAVYKEGDHGNAILSRFPILSWENLDISQSPLEKRGLLHAVVEVPQFREPLHALCVHLGLLEDFRTKQIDALMERMRQRIPPSAPLIAAGDFNDWRQKARQPLVGELKLREAFLEISGVHARSFPARLPLLNLDRIYFKGLEVASATCPKGRPWKTFSDHLPLIVDFAEKEKAHREPSA